MGHQDANAVIAYTQVTLLCEFPPWGSCSEYSGAKH